LADVVIPPAPKKAEHKPVHKEVSHTIKSSHASHTQDHSASSVTKTSETTIYEHEFAAFEKVLRITCVIAIIACFFLVILLSLMTESSPFLTFLGFIPLLLTIIVSYVLVDKYHAESGFLMVFPFIFVGVFLLLGVAGLLGGIDYLSLATINIILGIVFEMILVVQHSLLVHHHIKSEKHEKKTETHTHAGFHTDSKNLASEDTLVYKDMIDFRDDTDVERLVASIEDKAKAINAVIGRVYSARKGGTEHMRKKIRVDPTHYNEFSELKDEEVSKRKIAAIRLINKIRDRLLLLQQREIDVFTKTEVEMLMNLKREHYGHDKILEVLTKNDSDPIKTYHESALQFCDKVAKDLGAALVFGGEPKKKKHK
jgi:hypothetical protein